MENLTSLKMTAIQKLSNGSLTAKQISLLIDEVYKIGLQKSEKKTDL
jgi:hypothetical protein